MTTDSNRRPEGLDEFEAQRPRMFAIAYRMLGSATDAEDLLQEAWLRWRGVDQHQVANPAAYLTRVVTNLCLTVLSSARARREVYVGPWLPEPVLTAPIGSGAFGGLSPLDDVTQRDTVSFALLTVLERLSPAERAAYVLREAFAYSHREVAELIGTSEANARQLHARARRHVGVEREQRVDPTQWRDLVERFLAAARDGDVAGLEELLADGVVSHADGGGIINAARRPVLGRAKVARYLVGVLERFGVGVVPHLVEVNGGSAIVATLGSELRAVCFVRTGNGLITGLDIVLNPEKLAFAGVQLSRMGGLSSLSE